MYNAGINPTVGNASLNRVKYVINECKNAKISAKDIVVLRLKEIEENRLKDRQAGACRPSILDEETLEMVVRTLESDCNAERRRRDALMYCDRSRIKESDLLDIANHYQNEQGKPTIKSYRTVALWKKPRKQNTREGQRHRQAMDCRYMFTCKKPEKTLEETHIDTRHQRAHVKIMRMAAYEDASPIRSFTLDINVYDKATLKAGTDVGWQGTRGRGIFMSTQNPQEYIGHAFVGVENQLTPSAFRAMKWQVTSVNDKPSLVRTYDQSFVTVRPKDKEILGSSGAVWASEQIRLVQEYHAVRCLPSSLPTDIATLLLRVQHPCYLYSFCTSLDDEVDLQSFACYEEERKIHLHDGLHDAILSLRESCENIQVSNEVKTDALARGLEDLLHKLATRGIPDDSGEFKALCDTICDQVKRYPNRPVPYPNILEFTDKGPGAGVHNVEVQDFFVLVCKLLESDHRIRLHRASHGSAQNEAERTNAAIGEALTTGRPVEPPADPFHGRTASQMDSMTLKAVEEHCLSWKMENTWRLAREVSGRIHDEPGPGKHEQSLYMSLVILRSSRSYIFLPSISFTGRRHLLVSEARCAGKLCF